jgi:hypothetical protein
MHKQVGCKQKKKKIYIYIYIYICIYVILTKLKNFGKGRKEIKGWNVDVGNDKISVEIH